jgi:tellurite resistance protein
MPSTAERIPLNTFAIAFGTAGLADLWSTSVAALRWPTAVGIAFWVAAAIVWVWLIVAHTVRGARSTATFASQLRHPVQGPLAALVPVVGMLLGDELHVYAPLAGDILLIASIVAAALFAAWILALWMRGPITVDAIHGGYFLPTVATSFIGAAGAGDAGMKALALSLFFVGCFFWAVMFAVIVARLAVRPPLPAALVPTLAIFLAPPAAASAGWFAITGLVSSPIAVGLLGFTVLMLLLELALIPAFRKLAFSLGFWSFTFPLAAAARVGVDWASMLRFAGCTALIIALLAITTAVVLAVAIQSVRLAAAGLRSAEATLASADDEAAGH